MEFLRNLLLVLHLVGFAALFGGWFVQTRSETKVANTAMLHGALTQLVTGLALVGVAYPLHDDDPDTYAEPDNAKIAVKLLVLIAILVPVLVGRRRPSIPTAWWAAIGALTLVDVVVAVFW